MSPEDPQEAPLETPLETAARLESEPRKPEAEALVEDIDQFVARTDPEHLPAAEAQLAEWQPPADVPARVDGAVGEPDEDVVSVFSAYTEYEANIVKGVLDAAGIPASFDNLGGTVMGGIFAAGEQVWADIVVPVRYADAARQAIVDASTGSDVDTDTDTVDYAATPSQQIS